MKNAVRRTASLMFLLLLLFSAASFSVPAQAESQVRTVRVGWYNSDHFQEGEADSILKSGYSYEYLQSVANYTGWTYEYVSGGWSDLYDAFLSGDIDLLAGLSYTESRAPLMNYPGFEMGFEAYYIYKKAGNDAISGSDLSTLAGKRVGTLQNNLMTTFFEAWMAETGAACEEILFDDFQERDDAFASGEIDALIAVNNNVPSNSGMTPVVMVGESSYYLAVTKERTDLLAELNHALAVINESNPYFTQSLQIKYFQNTAVNAAIPPEERAWVDVHDALQVGYLEDYLPYCGLDPDGNPSGVMTDIFQEWQEQLSLSGRLQIAYKPYARYNDMIAALQSGEIDCAFPVYDSIATSEQLGIVQTHDLVESSIHLVYRGEYSEETTRIIALTDRSAFQQAYAALYYPDSELYLADTPAGCLDAIKQGKASCAFFSSGRIESYLSQRAYKSLTRLTLDDTINYCIGVKKGNNVVYSLLSRGIPLIDKSNMTNAMYAYMNTAPAYTLADFIQEYVMLVLAIALVIIGLIVAVAIMLAISLRRAKEQRDKELAMLDVVTRQNEELEAARDHLEEAVRLAEQASRAKTAFLFNMSHDIRTPMNAILGFAALAGQHSEESDKLRDYLGKIQSSGTVLMSILNNVLEMSRIEKGELELDEQPCRLQPFYDTIYAMFQEQMQQKAIEFVSSIDLRHSCVWCDQTKLQEILLNILSNAHKFTGAGGSVSLRAEELPAAQADRTVLRTTVRDTGCGMSEEFLGHIFDEFAREKNSEKNTIEGTGLGMSIVKSLTECMGGTVTVESRPGKGTTVTLSLPLRVASEENAADIQTAGEPDFTGKRILLAEDNDLNAEIAAEILSEAGFDIDRAEDGQVCVNKMKERPAGYYDLILMDIQMPNMNGYDATRAIRALPDPDKSSVPIFAITANAFEEDRQAALASGMNGHLGKPIIVSDLMRTLSDALRTAARR